MINWLYSPSSPAIAQYVECYWFLVKQPDSLSHHFPKLNPDPNGHLIITPKGQAYQYDTTTQSAKGQGSHWLFPHRDTYRMDHSQLSCLLGVKFHVGALYGLNLTPKQPLLDCVTSLDESKTLPPLTLNETALLSAAKHDRRCCWEQLDALLLPWLLQGQQDKYTELTQQALPLLVNTPISEMGAKLHCSQRTLERSFSRVTGMTLKQYQTMQRLDAMLEYLYPLKGKEIDWSQVAYQFGFSDQPHLIRTLKNGLGLTPSEYARQRDFTIDIYGGVESE